MEYKPVEGGLDEDICFVCSNDAGDSATEKIMGIKQSDKCAETNCQCKTAFNLKADHVIPKDTTFEYSGETEIDIGNAFDIFFTNSEVISGCSVN